MPRRGAAAGKGFFNRACRRGSAGYAEQIRL